MGSSTEGTVPEPDIQNDDIEDRLRAVERLTRLFRFERFVYVSFGVLAFVMLLLSLGFALYKQEASAGILGAFGSSGVVAYTGGRVIVMWNRALAFVVQVAPERGDAE